MERIGLIIIIIFFTGAGYIGGYIVGNLKGIKEGFDKCWSIYNQKSS